MHESFYNAREAKMDQVEDLVKKIKVMKEFKTSQNSDFKS